MKITSGPNWQFYAVTGLFLHFSYNSGSIWPILGWVAFCVLLIPLCLQIHKWEKAADEQMCKDFPFDPYIQKKYGHKHSEDASGK